MDEQKLQAIKEARDSLNRVQDFDVMLLSRLDELGTSMCFRDAVKPSENVLNLYKQLPIEVLDSLALNMINQVKESANATYNLFNEISKFTAEQGVATRDNIIKKVEKEYDRVFIVLHPMISYSVRKTTDFAKLEADARSKLQSIEDKSNALEESMEQHGQNAAKILESIKKVAEEHGVSQQAIYFKEEATRHTNASNFWLVFTAIFAVALIITAFTFLKWNIDLTQHAGNETYAIVQLSISKVLVFATLSFLLGMSAKNYLANKHNEVINRHRENALKTYEALVSAAGDNANRDIVLTNASECIFSSQPTGFSKSDDSEGKALSMLSIAPTAIKSLTEH